MNHQASEIAGAGWFRLIEQLRHAGGPRVGACLTDDELVDYATDSLSPLQRNERDAHLASCSHCCEELDELFAAADRWLGPSGEAPIAQLRGRLERVWAAMNQESSDTVLSGSIVSGVRSPAVRQRQKAFPAIPTVVYAAAAVVIVALGVVFFVQSRRFGAEMTSMREEQAATQRRSQALQQQLAEARRDTDRVLPQASAATGAAAHVPPTGLIVATTLIPGGSRSGDSGDVPALVVRRAVTSVVLNLVLKQNDHPAGYVAIVTTADGTVVAQTGTLKSHIDSNGQPGIGVRLAARLFSSDDYVIRLNGVTPDGLTETVDTYTVRVERRPE
jgi:hypothetical protein